MKERPILFSGPMVRAILEGRKTQTRRVVKPQPDLIPSDVPPAPGDNGYWWPASKAQSMVQTRDMPCYCPYGVPGDRLWVREAWAADEMWDRVPPRDIPEGQRIWLEGSGFDRGVKGRLRPSIHMPRWASRILLEVVSIRVERLQEISEDDAKAEGGTANIMLNYRAPFSYLWKLIYGHEGPNSWAANPWVWVVEFKRVLP